MKAISIDQLAYTEREKQEKREKNTTDRTKQTHRKVTTNEKHEMPQVVLHNGAITQANSKPILGERASAM